MISDFMMFKPIAAMKMAVLAVAASALLHSCGDGRASKLMKEREAFLRAKDSTEQACLRRIGEIDTIKMPTEKNYWIWVAIQEEKDLLEKGMEEKVGALEDSINRRNELMRELDAFGNRLKKGVP